MSQRQSFRVRPAIKTEAKVEASEEAPPPPRYPYLTCGYEVEREAPYVEWLKSAQDEILGSVPPEVCLDRFSVLLGVFAGYRLDTPIDWWPVYKDLKAGDIAVIRLSGIHVPDEIRNGRTFDVSEHPASEDREGVPTPTLPRGPWLSDLLEWAGSILMPPTPLPEGDRSRYALPPHEVFAEHSFVTGLGPIGLGLVREDASGPNSFGYFGAPVGMFLPFPVELMDYLLEPSRHEGEWFVGFSSGEVGDCPVAIRASMPDREGSESLSYLSPEEFRNLVTWIGEEYDPDGWFREGLDQLESASKKIRSSPGLDDSKAEVEEPKGSGWDNWELASPSTAERLKSPWGIQMISLERRERMIHAISALASGIEGTEVEADVLERLRYALRAFEEATAEDALQVARNLLNLGDLFMGESLSEDGDLAFPVGDILVPIAEHQGASLNAVVEAISNGLVDRRSVPDTHKPKLEPGEDILWSPVADDLAQIYLGWVRACLAADPRTTLAIFSIPISGSVFDELLEALTEYWECSSGTGGVTENLAFDQLFGYADSQDRDGCFGATVNSQYWTNPEHEQAKSVLLPINAIQAAICWQASHQFRAVGEFVIPEPLDNLADGRKPDWAEELAGESEVDVLRAGYSMIVAEKRTVIFLAGLAGRVRFARG